MDRLSGKVAVVTGAGSGIGRALATRFVAEGMDVVIADVSDQRLATVERELSGRGGSVTAARCDTSSADEVAALAEKTLDTYGAVHVVCNNAGVLGTADAWTGPLSEWEWVLGVNLYGVIHGVRAFLPILTEQGEGHIVNTASMAGLTTMIGAAPYVVSKHGVVALSESLYLELKTAGSPVGVSVLCPGFVRTELMNSPWSEALGPRPTPATASVVTTTFDALRSGIDAGMPPAAVADQVVTAILADRFWILTHEHSRKHPIERARRASRQENPALGPPSARPRLSRVARVLRSRRAALRR